MPLKKGKIMKAFYKAIENRIKATGCPVYVSGQEVYDDICDEIEDKENGSYLFMSKKDNDIYFEYKIDIMDDQFNLVYLIIHTPEQDWKVEFD